MRKLLIFAVLYLYSAIKYFLKKDKKAPEGIRGSVVTMFFDPDYPDRLHGVVAFVLPEGVTPDDFEDDLWGPFGFTSEIDVFGLHLYGRDTWGTVNIRQLDLNSQVAAACGSDPKQIILLAGVRSLKNEHIFPLNDSRQFVLVRKTTES